MALPKISIPSRNHAGFTLIELLVVMGLIGILAALGLVVSMDAYRGYSFRGERDLVISLLQKARSQSINNVCVGTGCTDGQPHGVHFENDKYVLFQGTYDSSSSSNIQIISAKPISHTGLTEIIFNQLQGTTAGGGTLTLSDPTHSSVITITNEGQITWTN